MAAATVATRLSTNGSPGLQLQERRKLGER